MLRYTSAVLSNPRVQICLNVQVMPASIPCRYQKAEMAFTKP